jgi:hypothetical protein
MPYTTFPPNPNVDDIFVSSETNKGVFVCTTAGVWVKIAELSAGGSPSWGTIQGTLVNQTDLQSALDAKANNSSIQPIGFTILANDTLPQALATNIVTRLTVTAARTLTTTVPAAGVRCAVMVLTSGTVAFTITFGTGFKPVNTLSTGTVTNRIFVVNFISNGTSLYEAGRTAAMVA